MYTYFKDLQALKACCPIEGGVWNKDILQGYMIYCCVEGFQQYIDEFMANYQDDEGLDRKSTRLNSCLIFC